jgi:hypothetical protein
VTVGGDKALRHTRFRARVPEHLGDARRGADLGQRGGKAIPEAHDAGKGAMLSQKKRKRIEECFGWLNTIALVAQSAASRNAEGRLDFHDRLRVVQPGAHAEPDRFGAKGSRHGRSDGPDRDQIFPELLTYTMGDSSVVFPAFELILVAKNLERIGSRHQYRRRRHLYLCRPRRPAHTVDRR